MFSDKINLKDSTQIHILETKWGDRLIGQVVKIENTQLTFRINERSMLTYDFSEIKSVGVYGEDDFKDLLSAPYEKETAWGTENLIYSSTGFNFPARTGELRNIELLLNTFDYGITDNFSLGGGIVVPVAIIIRGKITAQIVPEVNLGVGINNIVPLVDTDPAIISHAYLAATIGTPDRFINVTTGYGIALGESDNNPFILSFGGSFTFAKRWRFKMDAIWVTESGREGLIPGFMLGWSKGKSRIEFGTAVIPDTSVPLIPLVAFGVRID
ncbi:MAG: hypothetical protein DHS20C18_16700 [Saprospiraceae bacterium]|nr:MAG: hypothetical protein DHS20C18_16700 [Saprospiraceae bacterium]